MQLSHLSFLGLLALATVGQTAPLNGRDLELSDISPGNATNRDDGEMTLMGGYDATCRACFFIKGGGLSYDGGPEYQCQCGDGRGGWPTSRVNLNNRLGNNNGNLVWNSAGAWNSCSQIGRYESTQWRIYGHCRRRDGSTNFDVVFDLRNHLTNRNGQLVMD